MSQKIPLFVGLHESSGHPETALDIDLVAALKEQQKRHDTETIERHNKIMTLTAEEIQLRDVQEDIKAEKLNAEKREEVREKFKQELAAKGEQLEVAAEVAEEEKDTFPSKSEIKGIGYWTDNVTVGGNPNEYVTKDSGQRAKFESGMVRDTTEGKTLWHKVADGPLLQRWAELLTRGAEKYPDEEAGKPNWMLAEGQVELHRFRQSAFRHFMQWFNGDTDEDHAAAVFFNLNGAEFVKGKLDSTTTTG